MNDSTREAISAAAGKLIREAFIVRGMPAACGVLLVFSDGTELSVTFELETKMTPDVLHYRWNHDETELL